MNQTDRRKPAILIDPVNFYQTYGNILQRQPTQSPNPQTNPTINMGTNYLPNQPILDGLMSKINASNIFSEISSNISPTQGLLGTTPLKQPPTPLQPNTHNDMSLQSNTTSIAQPRDGFFLGNNTNTVKQNSTISNQHHHPIDLDALALDFPNISQDIWNSIFEDQHQTNTPVDTNVFVPLLQQQQSLPLSASTSSIKTSTPSISTGSSNTNNVSAVQEAETFKQLQLDNQQQVLELQQALQKQGDLLKQMGQLKQQNEILMQSLLETYQSMQQQLQQVKNNINYIDRPLSGLPQDRQFIVPHFQATPLVTNQQLQTNMVWNKSNLHTLMQSNQVMTQHHLQTFANMPMSIWDRHTLELIGFNTSFLQLVGRTEQELMTTGFCIHHLAPPHTRFVFETIQRCLVKARIYHFEGSQTVYRPQFNDTIYLTSSYYFDTNVFTCTHRRIPKNDDHFVIENKVFEKDFELDEKNPQVFQNFLYYKMNKYVSELQKYH